MQRVIYSLWKELDRPRSSLSGSWDWIKIFLSLDRKADNKIVQLDLLQVAVVFSQTLIFYF